MTYELPAEFDSIVKVEGTPDEGTISRCLLEHVAIEAFTNGRDEPGNHIIEVRTTLPENLARRDSLATELGINIQDSAVPYVPDEFPDSIIPRIGFELRNCMLLRPRPLGEPAASDTARALGIGAEWWREDRAHTLRITLSAGKTAISQGLERLGIDNLQAREALDAKYETEELVRATEAGKLLVCGRPDNAADADAPTAILLPLHDNVFHLYSNLLLQTAEFTAFVRSHGANKQPGELDGQLAYAGARLHDMSGQDWYARTDTTQAPYRQFRRFLYGFIDPHSEAAIRFKEELDAMERVDKVDQEAKPDAAAIATLDQNLALMDRPGNMLDQVSPVVSSIIARFVKLNPNYDGTTI